MNADALKELLEKLVATIETLGNQTAALTASGDTLRAINEQPGAASIAGDIRWKTMELRKLFDKRVGDL
jgi:hypothetical protein